MPQTCRQVTPTSLRLARSMSQYQCRSTAPCNVRGKSRLPKLEHEAIALDSVALLARDRPKNHFVMVDTLINSHVLAFLMVRNASTFPRSRFSDAEECFQRAREATGPWQQPIAIAMVVSRHPMQPTATLGRSGTESLADPVPGQFLVANL